MCCPELARWLNATRAPLPGRAALSRGTSSGTRPGTRATVKQLDSLAGLRRPRTASSHDPPARPRRDSAERLREHAAGRLARRHPGDRRADHARRQLSPQRLGVGRPSAGRYTQVESGARRHYAGSPLSTRPYPRQRLRHEARALSTRTSPGMSTAVSRRTSPQDARRDKLTPERSRRWCRCGVNPLFVCGFDSCSPADAAHRSVDLELGEDQPDRADGDCRGPASRTRA